MIHNSTLLPSFAVPGVLGPPIAQCILASRLLKSV